MRSSTGRWVSGDDFFNRETELGLLKRLVSDHNHILLSGQRRMGKTSIIRELGRRLKDEGWEFLFVDVEGDASPEDVVARIAGEARTFQPIAQKLGGILGRLIKHNIDEVSALNVRVKIRSHLDENTWARYGEQLFHACAKHDKRVLLAIDELPIFLKRMHRQNPDLAPIELFLSWLRGLVQELGERAPVLILSGSIGLEPMVRRFGLSDRVNHLHPYRLRPWDLATSIDCFETLARSNGVSIEPGVAQAVHAKLGIGIPHQIQSFFARLEDYRAIKGLDQLTVSDVDEVYRTELLGPSGQSDLAHYESRLRDVFDDTGTLAMKVLAEAAIQGRFTQRARMALEDELSTHGADISRRIAEVIDVLEHDGYLRATDCGHQFCSNLLKDWWAARFRDHVRPLDPQAIDESPEPLR